MKIKYSISKIEHVLLFVFVLLAFALFATGIFAEIVQSYNESVVQHKNELARGAGVKNIISFAACGGFNDGVPLLNLITFLILLALIRSGRYVISTALTLFYASLLLIGVVVRLDGRGSLGSENFFTDPWLELWMKTSFFDYLTTFVIAVLLFWQGSILLRLRLGGRNDVSLP